MPIEIVLKEFHDVPISIIKGGNEYEYFNLNCNLFSCYHNFNHQRSLTMFDAIIALVALAAFWTVIIGALACLGLFVVIVIEGGSK